MTPHRHPIGRLVAGALLLLLFVVWLPLELPAQNDNITARKREIERLEKQIKEQEKEIANLKKGRSTAEQKARKLAQQIESRNDLIERSEAEEREVKQEVKRADSSLRVLNSDLTALKEQYGEMVREAYRNYRHNNYLSYLFSSESFAQVARRIANLREAAAMRNHQIDQIRTLEQAARAEQEVLAFRQHQLDSVQRSLSKQKQRLQQDANEARRNINALSKREKEALKKQQSRKKELDAAIAELRKLTKGNKEGAGFSKNTSNLRLPVEGGTVKKYHGNMAEVVGRKGARVISIYEGKVVDIKQNRITGKYDVYVAHGEYITSYANLSSVSVEKGSSVKRNQALGIIGSSVDVLTMKSEYLLVFGIYPPNPKEVMRASDCFKK